MDDNKKELKKEIIYWQDKLWDILIEKNKFLPMIASLSAMVLIVATFNEKIIEVTNFVKILLSLLLFVIIFSFWLGFYESEKTIKSIFKKFSELLKRETKDLYKTRSKFIIYSQYFIFLVFTFVIISLIFLIW